MRWLLVAVGLLQLQLTVATQLYGVAESLSQVAANTGSAKGAGKVPPDALRQRDHENNELRRALKRQQQLTATSGLLQSPGFCSSPWSWWAK